MDWLDRSLRQSPPVTDQTKDTVRQDERVLAHAVHQLATITQGVLGSAEMLRPHVAEGGMTVLERLEVQTRSLAHLVTNLLEFWRHRAAGTLNLERVAVSDVCEHARALAAMLVGDKEIAVTTSVAPGAESVVSDREKLERILSNLASNAAKHTARGHIEIGARRTDGLVRLAVRDTGIGVEPDEQERIFTPFYRGARAAAQADTGLGLALAQDLAGLLGTHIAVADGNGAGVTFFLDLPAAS